MSPLRLSALGTVLLTTLVGCSSSGATDTTSEPHGGSGGSSNVSSGGHPSAGGSGNVSSSGSAGETISGGSAGSSGAPSGNAGACPPSWTVSPGCGASTSPSSAPPDFGDRVLILDPSMSKADVQSKLDKADQEMEDEQFGNNGYAYLFKPGNYGSDGDSLDVRVGFYTHVIGLGKSPDDVTITGAVRSKAFLDGGNATCNFWRTAENFAVVPGSDIDNGIDVWAVSQGTAIRRAHVKGSLQLHDNGWASGGFVVDTQADDTIDAGGQQQFLTRNTEFNKWTGSGWNIVYVGDVGAPKSSWPQPPRTTVDKTPILREKPFLYLDASGNYFVMVPQIKMASSGVSWSGDNAPPGSPISIDNFYIGKPTDTASTLNAALASGKHLILTPGDYKLDGPIQITNPNTVVLGIGFPVLTPTQGNTLISIADVDGVSVSGVLIEAGKQSSATLLQAGDTGSSADHSHNPSALFDVHCRIGGNIAGTAQICFTINSKNMLIDNTWLWRADHGAGADWNTNKSDSGIVVNGEDVTIYGLFSEHFQKFQTLWNANGGNVYFYQSELPYDPPSQSAWKNGSENGYPSYKVADTVTTHQAQGLGVYAFFQQSMNDANAIETPTGDGIQMHHMMTYGDGISHIINGQGDASGAYSDN